MAAVPPDTGTQPEAQQDAAVAAPQQPPLSEAQAALASVFNGMAALHAELDNERKGLAIIARKGPADVARELPRRIANGTLQLLNNVLGHISNLTLILSNVEDRTVALEAADDISDVIGSVGEFHDFLVDVLDLCEAFTVYAVSDEDKTLLGNVREEAEAMLARMDEGEEPEDEEPEDGESGDVASPATDEASVASAPVEDAPAEEALPAGEESGDAS